MPAHTFNQSSERSHVSIYDSSAGLWRRWNQNLTHSMIEWQGHLLSCPGRMIANSIPARLVATRMRVALPRARACHCHAHAHGHTMRACARTYHAHAQGYAMHRDLASKIVQPVKIENQIQNRCPSGNADYLHFISSRKNTLCLII